MGGLFRHQRHCHQRRRHRPQTAIAPFYDAAGLYTNALWIGPSRGYVDPVKEINATVTALDNRLMTYSEAIAERGRDFDEVMDEREEEEGRLKYLAPED